MIVIGEVLAVTNSPIIADALGEAARSGLSRVLVQGGFETVGNKEVAPIVFEAVSRSGTDWIWNEDPSISIADIVDDVEIVNIGVPVGSIDNCGDFGANTLENVYRRKKWQGQYRMKLTD